MLIVLPKEQIVKIIDSKKITDLPHVNLIRVRYQDKNGRDKAWVYASRGNSGRPDAVVIVPFHEGEEKLVLIREYRVPLQGEQYGFPAGLVDPRETVEDAGKRELMEETGLTVSRVVLQGPPVYSSSGMTDESVSLLYVTCQGRPSTHLNEGSEEIEVLLVSRDEARELLNREHLSFDVKTWIVLERFAATGAVI